VLRRAGPDIAIETWRCPAHTRAPGNEEADRRARESDARWVERLGFPDWAGARAAPLPRSLAHLKRATPVRKWAEEARQWAGGRASREKHKMQGGTAAGSSKRLVSRFRRLKTGHCHSGRYLHWTKNLPTAQCWWWRCRTQTWDKPLQGVPRVEGPAEDPVGRGAGGKQGGEDPV